MKKIKIEWLTSVLFAIAIFAFFTFLYPFHLNYQEQYQLFLFTGDYLSDHFGKPGGISDYIGNFFTQFYFYSWLGAIILSVALTSLQQIVWNLSKKLGTQRQWFAISFIPPVLYWGLLCDENYLFGGVIALILTTSLISLYLKIKTTQLKIAFTVLVVPLDYWLAGGTFLFFSAFVIVYELLCQTMGRSGLTIQLLIIAALSFAGPLIAEAANLQYPAAQIWTGVNYYRFTSNFPLPILVTGVFTIGLPFFLLLVSSKIKMSKPEVIIILLLLLLVPGTFLYIKKSMNRSKEEVMAYDFNVRMRRWDKVIALADKRAPSSPLSVTCLNLALAEKGELASKMFNYYQKGPQGLLPDFTRDYTIPMITGEVYYHLGFINTAQRYAFEAMEALPDFQKSVRAIRRLAETNIINGCYPVAGKYLHLLQKTFYYRKWATKALETISSEQQIDQHPEWGRLRKCRIKDDFLFSEKEKDMMLGLLFTHANNKMAFEYLLAYCLLNKDLQHFIQYFPMGKSLGYSSIPESYQQALLYAWRVSKHKPGDKFPYPVSPATIQNFQNYGHIAANSPTPEPALRKAFGNTYWYYLQFRN